MTPPITPKNQVWSTSKKLLALGILVLSATGALMRQAAPSAPAAVGVSSSLSSAVPASSPNAEDAFASLQTGMSYAQAVAILGSQGQEVVSNEIAGVKTVYYEWKNEKLWANMNAVFQDDRLVSKTQFDLE